jgi:hypothetical protein
MNRRDLVKLGNPPIKQLGAGGILDAGVGEQQMMEVGQIDVALADVAVPDAHQTGRQSGSRFIRMR